MTRIAAYIVSLGLGLASTPAVMAKDVVVTLDQAITIARRAFVKGDIATANKLSYGVLAQRPDNASALVLVAATDPKLGRVKEGRKAGARAFKLAKDPSLRFEAAYFTASAAATSENFGIAKYWLRRAYQAAPTDATKQQAQRDFQTVRRRDPLQIHLGFSVTPTSNVNGGSSSSNLTITGVDLVGALSETGRALSGTRISSNARLSYRLSESQKHKTSLGLSVSSNNYLLSSGSRRRLQEEQDANVALGRTPGRIARGSDFDVLQAEVSLTHQITPTSAYIPDTYTVAAGGVTYGGRGLYNFGRLSVSRGYTIDKRNSLRFSLSNTWFNYDTPELDARAARISAQHAHGFENGDVLRSTLSYSTTSSDDDNKASNTVSADIRYAFAKNFGPEALPIQLDLGLSIGQRTYNIYRIGIINVPGGRDDTFGVATIGAKLPSINYWGFSPRVTAQYSRTRSNVSRFELRDLSMNLSVVSSF